MYSRMLSPYTIMIFGNTRMGCPIRVLIRRINTDYPTLVDVAMRAAKMDFAILTSTVNRLGDKGDVEQLHKITGSVKDLRGQIRLVSVGLSFINHIRRLTFQTSISTRCTPPLCLLLVRRRASRAQGHISDSERRATRRAQL